jgi:hypothetical protein
VVIRTTLQVTSNTMMGRAVGSGARVESADRPMLRRAAAPIPIT